MNLRELCQILETELSRLFEELRSGIAAREDSRAFGAMIEHRITQNWESICSREGFVPVDLPGRRTIFDFGFKVDNRIVGIDVKTKTWIQLSIPTEEFAPSVIFSSSWRTIMVTSS